MDYQETRVTAACAGFAAWDDAVARIEVVVRSPGAPAPYEPGSFYTRELPHLLAVLERMPRLDAILVDAYVWLGPDAPGLGARVADAYGAPVIGVAKTRFADASAIEVVRGPGKRPLYVTSIGIDPAHAAQCVTEMHGEFRIPTLLQRVDALARGRTL